MTVETIAIADYQATDIASQYFGPLRPKKQTKATKAIADPRDAAERRLMAALEELKAAELADQAEPYDDEAERQVDDILKELASGD